MARYNGTQAQGGKRRWGFTRASDAAGALVAGAGASRGFAEQRLLTHWADIVGVDLAALCRPVKVSYRGREPGLGATLVVLVEGALAAELTHREAEIVERVNRVHGYRAISRLRVTQTHGTLADLVGSPDPGDSAAQPPPEPPSAPVMAVCDEGLRAALARLEVNVRRRALRDRATPSRHLAPEGNAS